MKKNKVYLLLILLFAFGLRTYKLNSLELFGDELDVGYHAYSLMKTGRDYYGQLLPFYIHSFAEWRAPLLMYVAAPFVTTFGLNEWGVRLPVALLGLADVVLIYWLVKALSKSEQIGLTAAVILGIVPWHMHYSRTAFEATLLLTLVLAGTLTFLKKKWLMTVIFFALSLYAYNTANIFVPLWILTLFLITKQKIGRLFNIYYLIFAIFSIPLTLIVIKGEGASRFKSISIFNNQQTIDQIVFKRTTGISPTVERLFHNKLTGWGSEFIENYAKAFSPQFLFLGGDPTPRHNPPGFGEFYWILLPFLLIGTATFLNNKNIKFKQLVFFWLLISPVPSALTAGGGDQATRLFLMLPPLVILISIGICRFASVSFLKLLIVNCSLLIVLIFWLHNYFVHYPKEQYRYWHYGYKEAMSWLKDNEGDYDRVIINNNHEPILLRYLFWTKKEPVWFRNKFAGDETKTGVLSRFNGFILGKVIFGAIDGQDKQKWLEDNLDKKTLYLAFQLDEVPGDWNWEKEPPEGLKVLKTVYDPWEKPMMYWITKKI